VVQGNEIVRCGSYEGNVSLLVGATSTSGASQLDDVFVGDNTILNSFGNGILVLAGAENTALENNTVENSTGTGILIQAGSIGLELLGNSVTGEPSGQAAFLDQSSPIFGPITNPISGASYNSENSVQTESCAEGGLDVGYISNGSYTVYNNVDLTDITSFVARVASAGSGGNIEVCLDSPTGTVIGTATVPVTGGWQTWTMVSCNLTGASGYHNIYLVYTGGGGYLFNVEWFSFSGTIPVTEASTYSSESGGVETESCNEGGLDVGYIGNGCYTVYKSVNLTGVKTFYARVASAGSGGNIQVRTGSATGPLLGTVAVPVTGDWQDWITVSCPLTGATGTQSLYLVYTGGGGYLFNIEWYAFALPTIGATEAASFNSMSGAWTEACSEGGLDIGGITNGDYTVYNDVNMTGLAVFNARVASAGSGGNIQIRLDSPTGTLVGTVTVPVNGAWQTYSTVSCNLTASTGFHNVYLVYTGGGGYLFNVEWFELLY
jgi:hypothetical protein